MASQLEESITFACQECGKTIRLPAYYSGRVGDCPECHSYVDVPRESDESAIGGREADLPKYAGVAARTNAQLWLEVSAVLCLAYVPWLWRTIGSIGVTRPATDRTVYGLIYLFIDALQVSLPLLAIIALSGDRWSLFGIVRPKWGTDVIIGCVIWFGCYICRWYVISLLPAAVLKMPHPPRVAHHLGAQGILPCALMFVICVVNSSAQELVFRGYLIPRFERLLRSTWLAVLVTAVLFGSFHLYQGVAATILITAGAVVYGAAFCVLRRLWPLCVAHTLNNFMLWL